ncbi:MAG: hypothetical protein RR912_06255 [Clostridium sp.]
MLTKINKLNSNFYQHFRRSFQIRENDSNVDYTLTVRLPRGSENGIYIDLPEIKKASGYIQSDLSIASPPKDCDAIIVDCDKEVVYLIEMKRTSKASTNTHLNEQLCAGAKWWEHIEFCIDSQSIQEVKRIAVMVEERRSRSRAKKDLRNQQDNGYGFYKFLGNSLSLDRVI